MSSLLIRQMCDSDIIQIEKHFYGFQKHLHRYERQKNNEAVYLIAWQDDIPVGHLLLKWKGTSREPVVSLVKQCPELEGMRVIDEYKRQGIATKLLQRAIELTIDSGYDKLGLSVRTDNVPALSLYSRMGFEDLGVGEFVLSWPWTDKEGNRKIIEETCIYMVKHL